MNAIIQSRIDAQSRGTSAAIADISNGRVLAALVERLKACFDPAAATSTFTSKAVFRDDNLEIVRVEEFEKTLAQEHVDEFCGYVAVLGTLLENPDVQRFIETNLTISQLRPKNERTD